jgi:Bacterial Ig-like domain
MAMKNWTGIVGACGFAVATGGVACGSSFSGDCQDSRTCEQEPQAGAGGSTTGTMGMGGLEQGGEPAIVAGSPSGADAGAAGSGEALPVAGASGAGGAGAGGAGDEGGAAGAGSVVPVNAKPMVLSVTPSSASPAEPDAVVVITFSEPLAAGTVAGGVKVMYGDEAVAGQLKYADSKATFTPAAPLGLAGEYSVQVATSVTDLEGAGFAEPFEAKFTVRDGAFSTVSAVKSGVYLLAEHVPVEPDGAALLSWIDSGQGDDCPVRVQRFLHGAGVGSPQSLSGADSTSCSGVTAATNQEGVSAVAWVEYRYMYGGAFIRQFRGGAWSSDDNQRSTDTQTVAFGLGIGPTGWVSLLEHSTSLLRAHQTLADGKWLTKSVLDSTAQSKLATPALAFDASGNGLAVWRVHPAAATAEQISFSRFDATTKKWVTGELLKGSKATQAGASYERGAPAIAVAPAGDAVAVWVAREVGKGAIVASRFTPQGGWTTPVDIGPTLSPEMLDDQPALVYDGRGFVAAFTASSGATLGTYTVRYDSAGDRWLPAEKRQAALDVAPVIRMPKLATDGHGHSILVWATGSDPNYKLYFQRDAGKGWSATKGVPDGGIKQFGFEVAGAWSVAANARGQAALAWTSDDGSGNDKTISLASFD